MSIPVNGLPICTVCLGLGKWQPGCFNDSRCFLHRTEQSPEMHNSVLGVFDNLPNSNNSFSHQLSSYNLPPQVTTPQFFHQQMNLGSYRPLDSTSTQYRDLSSQTSTNSLGVGNLIFPPNLQQIEGETGTIQTCYEQSLSFVFGNEENGHVRVQTLNEDNVLDIENDIKFFEHQSRDLENGVNSNYAS